MLAHGWHPQLSCASPMLDPAAQAMNAAAGIRPPPLPAALPSPLRPSTHLAADGVLVGKQRHGLHLIPLVLHSHRWLHTTGCCRRSRRPQLQLHRAGGGAHQPAKQLVLRCGAWGGAGSNRWGRAAKFSPARHRLPPAEQRCRRCRAARHLSGRRSRACAPCWDRMLRVTGASVPAGARNARGARPGRGVWAGDG